MTSQPEPSTPVHPVLACAATIAGALKDIADVEPVLMSTDDKASALLHLGTLPSQVEAMRLAEALERRWAVLGAATLDGRVNLAQAEVIVRELDKLPNDIDLEIKASAEQHLIHEAASFGPRSLSILGRRVLDIVATEVAEEAEGKALEREEREAAKKSFVRSWRRGDGTTEIRMRISDAVANRFMSYLKSFSSPRKGVRGGQSVL